MSGVSAIKVIVLTPKAADKWLKLESLQIAISLFFPVILSKSSKYFIVFFSSGYRQSFWVWGSTLVALFLQWNHLTKMVFWLFSSKESFRFWEAFLFINAPIWIINALLMPWIIRENAIGSNGHQRNITTQKLLNNFYY